MMRFMHFISIIEIKLLVNNEQPKGIKKNRGMFLKKRKRIESMQIILFTWRFIQDLPLILILAGLEVVEKMQDVYD